MGGEFVIGGGNLLLSGTGGRLPTKRKSKSKKKGKKDRCLFSLSIERERETKRVRVCFVCVSEPLSVSV